MSVVEAPSPAPAPAALDLHEGIVQVGRRDDGKGCLRWPAHMWLLANTGEVVEGRCKATNLCRYCQKLYVIETVEMLTLDAAEHAPTIWLVLTAREHLTRADCRWHLRSIRNAARRLWPDVEWFVQVEFQRRGALHLNLLIKGVPVEDREQLHVVVSDRWCSRVDAEPVGQWSGAIADGVGVVRYISKMLAHGLKAEQAPPLGWRGHRTSQTRGYLVRPASAMREEARQALRLKREFWRLSQLRDEHGEQLPADVIEDVVQQRISEAAAKSWRLVTRIPRSGLLASCRDPDDAFVLGVEAAE